MACAKSPRDPSSGLTKADASSFLKCSSASSRSCPAGRWARCRSCRKKYSPPSVGAPALSRMMLVKYLSDASVEAVALFCGYHEHRPAPKKMLLVGEVTLKTS